MVTGISYFENESSSKLKLNETVLITFVTSHHRGTCRQFTQNNYLIINFFKFLWFSWPCSANFNHENDTSEDEKTYIRQVIQHCFVRSRREKVLTKSKFITPQFELIHSLIERVVAYAGNFAYSSLKRNNSDFFHVKFTAKSLWWSFTRMRPRCRFTNGNSFSTFGRKYLWLCVCWLRSRMFSSQYFVSISEKLENSFQ